jgi:cell division protein ZapE
MDLFHEWLPFSDKRRVHFHRFMLEIHDDVQNLKREPDTLAKIARNIAKNIRVLCFDELFVADIGDAMILARLFSGLLEHNVTLVITSNTPPQDLYLNGLQRQRFLPVIDLIEDHTEVIELGGDTDHRLKSLQQIHVYHVPHDHTADARLGEIFQRIAGRSTVLATKVSLNGRAVRARASAHGIIWFDFDVLCRGPQSRIDFAEISRTCHTLVLSDIPVLGPQDDDAARRFVELVDELYDRRVNLVASAAGPPETLYTGTRMRRGFRRVASRLWEFQSTGYITEPHRP